MDMVVQLGNQGYHSGECCGIIKHTFNIKRVLMDVLENSKTNLACEELQVECSEWMFREAEYFIKLKRIGLCAKFPIVNNANRY